ncbi:MULTISPECIES: DUF4365 domain-containing protein [Bacteroidales]|uniref:DUF4365 domain-containing protein n=1 Tax=Bacteroidales TaxID=171549 RepID=UPI0026064DD3|nr:MULTISPECIES: DUF4365 domain-containing protein [Bacteroidales]
MSLPKYPKTSTTERLGVLHIAAIFTEMGFIFREIPNSDTGIDGYIEEVNDNHETTARLLAVQIKSGKSYFNDQGEYFVYYADESHIKYWKLYPIPVILCIYNPETGYTYFQSIKCHSQDFSNKIYIPKGQILSLKNRDDVLINIAGFSTSYHTTQELYNIMKETRITVADSYVSFMDLFVGGLTNLCSDLFCDISVLSNLIDIRGKQPAIFIGCQEHEFLWQFIRFITKENLAIVNFDACLFDWEERKMDPRIIVSLTYRGIEYRDYVESKHPGTVCEAYVNLNTDYYWDERMEKLKINI